MNANQDLFTPQAKNRKHRFKAFPAADFQMNEKSGNAGKLFLFQMLFSFWNQKN